MPRIADDPEFQEWLEVQLGTFPAPSPEVARQLADLIGSENGADGTAPADATDPGHVPCD